MSEARSLPSPWSRRRARAWGSTLKSICVLLPCLSVQAPELWDSGSDPLPLTLTVCLHRPCLFTAVNVKAGTWKSLKSRASNIEAEMFHVCGVSAEREDASLHTTRHSLVFSCTQSVSFATGFTVCINMEATLCSNKSR